MSRSSAWTSRRAGWTAAGRRRSASGCASSRRAALAVVVATHDTEFAASWAERIVLMGPGTVIADGSAASVLAGGRHFATDVARILDGAGGALTPEAGARAARAGAGAMTWQLASFAILGVGLAAGLRLVRALAAERARARAGGGARRARGGRPAGVRRVPEREADHRHRAAGGLCARRRARFRGGGDHRRSCRTSSWATGPWTPWQMAAWGGVGDCGRAARARYARARAEPLAAGDRVRGRGRGLRRRDGHLPVDAGRASRTPRRGSPSAAARFPTTSRT